MARFIKPLLRRSFSWLAWLLRLAAVLAIAGWLYLHPGTVQIDWEGTTLQTSTGFAALIAFATLFVFGVVYHGWRLLLGWPRLLRRQRALAAQENGYKALNKGLLAVAAADTVTASKNAERAVGLLPELALTHLLAAQAAQLRHDDVTADRHLAILATHPEGQIFGLRGQLGRALQREDNTEGLRLARVAYQSHPTQPWVIDTNVQLEARQQHWLQAEKILRQAIRLGGPEAAKWKNDLAAVLCALSDSLAIRNDGDAALDCAREALKLHPGWTPAAVRVAGLWHKRAYRRRAQKVLSQAWEIMPHPELVTLWLQVSGTERTTDAAALTERLVAASPDNAEAALAMARACYNDRLWGMARQHAQRAIDYRPDRAAFRMMADIEQADNFTTTGMRAWLDKASDAPLEPHWQCLLTGELFPVWQALNRRMDFNTILWQTPLNVAKAERVVAEPAQLSRPQTFQEF